jgi:hypothetical protein
VIPSKRAAQNRAAQKAFRQRREQYIKDLEIKAKDLEDWQEEMDKLRKENGELRERVASLENQVAILTGGDTSKIAELNKSVSTIPTSSPITTSEVIEPIKSPQRSMSLPTASPPPPSSSSSSSSTPVLESIRPSSASPSIITSSSAVKRSHNESRLRHEHNNESDPITEEEGSFVPVPLRAPNPTGFETTPSYHPNDHTATLIGNESIKRRKLNNIGLPNTVQEPINNSITVNTHHPKALPIQQLPQQSLPPPQQLQYPPEFWNTSNTMPDMAAATASASGMGDLDLDFNFDPFFEDEFGPTLTNTNDFLPNANSGQVLDDLFAMLQTRQRPQIPMVPAEDNNESNIVNESLGKLG